MLITPWSNMAKIFKPKVSNPASTVKGDDAAKAAQKISISILLISLPVLYVSLLHVPPSNLFQDTTFWFLMSNTIIIIIATDSGFLCPHSTDSNPLYDEYVKRSKARDAGRPTPSPIATQPQIDVTGEDDKYSNSCNIEVTCDEENVVEERNSPAVEHPFALTFVTQDKGNEKGSEKENEEENEEGFVHEPLPLEIDSKQSSVRHRGPERSQSEMGKRGRTIFENERPLRRSTTEKKNRGGDRGDGEVGDQYSNMSNEELNRRVEDFIRRFKQIRLEELRNV